MDVQPSPMPLHMSDADPVARSAIVAFYRFEDEIPRDATLMTRVFRWFFKQKCPNYEHCQLTFTHGLAAPGDFHKTTFTTTKAHPFSHRNIRYKNENWECYEVVLEPEKRDELMRWCRTHENTPFNALAFYWNFFAPCTACTVDKQGKEFFCAEMVLTGLRQVVPLQSLWDVEPYLCTVDDLRDIVVSYPGFFRKTGLKPIESLALPDDGPVIQGEEIFSYPPAPARGGLVLPV